MRILFVSPEVAPYSEVGGLGEIGRALPAALRRGGHEVLTVTPLYRSARATEGLRPVPGLERGSVLVGNREWRWSAHLDSSTSTVLVEAEDLFERPQVYSDEADEPVRFAVFSRLALEVARLLPWSADVVHCHDWQTALIPALLRGPLSGSRGLPGAATVLTIHNLGHQGRFPLSILPDLGLGDHPDLLRRERREASELNVLETGLLHADQLTTVSPTYAREIQTPQGGAGLDEVLRRRRDRLAGILNGIDTDEWDPRTDRFIPWHYSSASLWRKERNKESLLEAVGLSHRPSVPVVGIVSRLVWQKGIEIMRGPLLHFLDTWDLRLVVLGSGEARYEDFFRWLADSYGGKVAFVAGYDRPLAHRIEAGVDVFLMPSLYEPCGLNQMYSLAYGTAPVVRRVGGLADTVTRFESTTGTGNGFVFDHYDEDALGWALGQALTLHTDRRSWRVLQANAMSEDNSWQARVAGYEAAYRRAADVVRREGRGIPG